MASCGAVYSELRSYPEAVQRAAASNLLITCCLAASRSEVLVGCSPSIAGRLAGRMAPVDRGDSLQLELLVRIGLG